MTTGPGAAPERPAGGAAPGRALRPSDLMVGLVIAVVALVPLATGTFVWAVNPQVTDWYRRVLVAPFDAALAFLVVALAVEAVRSRVRLRLGPLGILVGISGAWLLVAFAVHPSPLGVNLLLHIVGAGAIAVTVAGLAGDRRRTQFVLGAVGTVGVIEALLGIAQAIHRTNFGVKPLDFASNVLPLYRFGTSRAGQGGFLHPYDLLYFLLVCQGALLLGLRRAAQRWPWLVGLVVVSAGIGVTYGRSGFLGDVALILVAVGWGWRRGQRALAIGALAIVVGFGIGAASFGNGWAARAETTGSQQADSGRGQRLREAARLIREQPVIGVGPGRYVERLVTVPHTDLLPPHDVIANEAAETGIPGGLLSVAVLVLFAWRTFRRGPWATAILVAGLPMWLLDVFPYVLPAGLAISGLWVGLIELAGSPRTARRGATRGTGSAAA